MSILVCFRDTCRSRLLTLEFELEHLISSNSESSISVMSSHELPNHTNGLSTHDSVDGLRRQIDQEIQMLGDRIYALKTRRNSLAPISRLPSETLAKVFALTISHPLAYDALDWIQVSYVSRYWRQVALDHPSLWGNLVFRRPKWCKKMLERSKMAGLVVNFDSGDMPLKSVKILDLVMSQSPRFQELQLKCATKGEMETFLTTNPPFQVPIIRSLSFAINPDLQSRTNQSFTLPKSMLSVETPYLRQLDLRHCNITWDISLFDGLTSLTIHNTRWSARPTIEQLTNTLKRMPALEVLDLENVIPPSMPGMLALLARNSVNLIELTDLVVTSTISEYTSLIRLINIPTTTRIDFCCSDSNLSGIPGIIYHPEGAPNSAEDNAGLMPKRVVQILTMKWSDEDALVFNGWSSPYLPGKRPKPDLRLRLRFPDGFSTDQLQTAITDLCSTVDLQHLRSLRVALKFETVEKKTWIDLFGALPQLHRIHVEMDSTDTLIAALRELPPRLNSQKRSLSSRKTLGAPKSSLSTKAPSLYFSQLKYLTIQGGEFGDTGTLDSGVRPLRNCLRSRSQNNAKLQKLCLRKCYYLYDQDVDLLKEVVNVDWDEIVREHDGDDDNHQSQFWDYGEDEDDDDDDDDMGSD